MHVARPSRSAPFVAVLLLLLAGRVAADDPQAVVEGAADAFLAALESGDEEEAARVARQRAVDAWVLADALCRRGAHAAAARIASLVPGPDVERLPAYVEARRVRGERGGAHAAFVAAQAAFLTGDTEGAVAGLRALDAGEDDLLRARQHVGLGASLARLGRPDEALPAYTAAADAAERIGALRLAALALRLAGDLAVERYELAAAIPLFDRLRAVAATVGDRHQEAYAATLGAQTRLSLGEVGPVDDLIDAAQAGYAALDDREGLANVLSVRGQMLALRGRREEALAAIQEAQAIYDGLGLASGAARARTNASRVLATLGRWREAIDGLRQAADAFERLGEAVHVAMVTAALGETYWQRGDYPRALQHIERALALHERAGDRAGLAATLAMLASVYVSMGETGQAVAAYERALVLKEQLGDRRGAATTLTNLSSVCQDLGDLDRAEACARQSLAVHRELGDGPGAVLALGNIGNVQMARGDAAGALATFRQGLEAAEALGARAETARMTMQVARALAATGAAEDGLAMAEAARARFAELGDRGGEASALVILGWVRAAAGDLPGASRDLEEAARRAENLRATPDLVAALTQLTRVRLEAGEDALALSTARRALPLLDPLLAGHAEEDAARARAGHASLYAMGAWAALRLDDPAAASEFLEAGRAGSLLESLDAREMLRRRGLPEAVRDAEGRARADEAAAEAACRQAEAGGNLREIHAAREALDAARAARQAVVEGIQREQKAQADLFYPRAAPLEDEQAELGEGEALVLYGMLPPHALALVATRDGARVVALGEVEAVLQATSALDADDVHADPTAAVARLQALLVEPLGLGEDVRRVLLSPDGELAYLPFSLLLEGRGIAWLPSGTTWLWLREEARGGGEGVLGLGDPAYGARGAEGAAGDGTRGGALAALPATRPEVEGIADVALLGADATEAGLRAALRARPRWRALHLACHGLVDVEHPLRSALAVTPGAPDDGFLTALEVFGLEVPADLVVLSACETARGRIMRAEGIVGLTRAFMYAGAPRVLCSLWKVDDEATRALMERFYALWNPRDGTPGMDAAEALRDAQAFVRSQPRWSHPAFWAAWVLWGLP